MPFYIVDYNADAWNNLPVRLRQSIMYAWLKVLIKPIIDLAALFGNNRAINLYILAHNSQVCYMEAALNDTFDDSGRGIYISDPVYADAIYLFEDAELKPVYMAMDAELPVVGYEAPVYAFQDGEAYSGLGVQFIVNVPVAVVFDTDRMKALIDYYRLPSKNNYSIVTF